MEQFEYATYNKNTKEILLDKGNYTDKQKCSLNELGKQGWEVITSATSDHGAYLLKRKVEDNASPSADVSIKNIESIGGEDAARALTRAAYTGAMMALDQFMEKQRQQQNPSRQSADYEYSR